LRFQLRPDLFLLFLRGLELLRHTARKLFAILSYFFVLIFETARAFLFQKAITFGAAWRNAALYCFVFSSASTASACASSSRPVICFSLSASMLLMGEATCGLERSP
jgi:hypothetical protein